MLDTGIFLTLNTGFLHLPSPLFPLENLYHNTSKLSEPGSFFCISAVVGKTTFSEKGCQCNVWRTLLVNLDLKNRERCFVRERFDNASPFIGNPGMIAQLGFRKGWKKV